MSLAVRGNPRKGRSAFTLLELLLVLLLLILVAAVSWPSFDAWFQSYRLQEATDTIRTYWIKARTLAMDEGRAYRFAWDANTGIFRLAPDDLEHWPELAGTATGPLLSGFGYPPGLMVEQVLPDGVQFVPDATQGATLLFWPDGSAKIYTLDGLEPPEMQILLVDRRGQVRALQIRALTGGVTVIPLGRL